MPLISSSDAQDGYVAPDRSADDLSRITPGVFFGAPVALPRGPHALPRSDVLAEQRERLIAAITELIAAQGWTSVKIGALAARSKVSRTAFYACFESKEACAFAAYDRFIEVLLGALAEPVGEPASWTELTERMVDAYFAILERDLVAARAFLVEFDALGPPARERRRLALRRIASYLREMHERFRASDPLLAPVFADDVYVGIVYISRQLACDALDEHAEPDLRAIGQVIAPWLLTAYRPGAAAQQIVPTVVRSAS
jgi:AcrR family transcriptional regulator